MTGTNTAPKECRACGRAVPNAADPQRPGVSGCPRCGFINVLDEGNEYIPLETIQAEGLTASASADDIVKALEACAEISMDAAREIIRQIPGHSSRLLLTAMAERDARIQAIIERGVDDSGSTRDVILNATTQLLYLLLYELDVDFRRATEPSEQQLAEKLWQHLTLASRAFKLLASVGQGDAAPRVEKGHVVLAKTAQHTLKHEWMLNQWRWSRVHDAQTDQQLLSEYLHEAQELVLGFSSRDLLAIAAGNFATLGSAVVRDERLTFLQVDELPSDVLGMIELFTLSPKRVKAFGAPYYFDLGRRRASPAETLPQAAAGLNWTVYYPFNQGISAGGRPIVFSSPGILAQSFAWLESSRAQMFVRLGERLDRNDPRRRRIGELARAMSTRLEGSAAQRIQAAGYVARAGVKTMSGRQVPCGEIDVLAVRATDAGTRLLVIEAKDIDSTLHKYGGLDQQLASISRGASQLDRKVAWAGENWQSVARELGQAGDAPAEIYPLLVTRSYVPPNFGTTYPVVPIGALPLVLDRIESGDLCAAESLGKIARVMEAE